MQVSGNTIMREQAARAKFLEMYLARSQNVKETSMSTAVLPRGKDCEEKA